MILPMLYCKVLTNVVMSGDLDELKRDGEVASWGEERLCLHLQLLATQVAIVSMQRHMYCTTYNLLCTWMYNVHGTHTGIEDSKSTNLNNKITSTTI